LDGAVKAITNSVGDFNDRVRIHKEDAAKAANRRRQGEDNKERTKEDIEREVYINEMERKAQDYTTKGEKALRDLIDDDDELAMKDTIMKEVIENIPAAPVPRSAVRRQRRQGSSEGEGGENEESDVEEDGDAEADGPVVGAMELLEEAQAEYATKRATKTMRNRYIFLSTIMITNTNRNLGTTPKTTEVSKRPSTSPFTARVFLSLTQEHGSLKTLLATFSLSYRQ
jgi:hypothetical protein